MISVDSVAALSAFRSQVVLLFLVVTQSLFLILWLSFQPSEARSFPYFLVSRDHFVHPVALPSAFQSLVVPLVFVVTRSFFDAVALPPGVPRQVVGLIFCVRSFTYFSLSHDNFFDPVALTPALPSQLAPFFGVTRLLFHPVVFPPAFPSQIVPLFFVVTR